MIEAPQNPTDPPVWRSQSGLVQIRFVGRGGPANLADRVAEIAGMDRRLATLEQIHSAHVQTARDGSCGRGDALVTQESDLICAVVTADCVPVLLAGDRAIAAVHAGWRGLVAGVVQSALERMREEPERLTAWIGPAILGCCYEVGEDVAEQISLATGSPSIRAPEGDRPYIDLVDATRRTLHRLGVKSVHDVGVCTRCQHERLHSYRRDGGNAGRNLALIWRSPS